MRTMDKDCVAADAQDSVAADVKADFLAGYETAVSSLVQDHAALDKVRKQLETDPDLKPKLTPDNNW